MCLIVGHTIRRCVFLKDLGATVVGSRQTSVQEFVVGLGNPSVHLVAKPEAEEKQVLQDWMSRDLNIPKEAKHIHISKCYYSAVSSAPHSQHVLRVDVLHDGVLPVEHYSPGYFAVEKVKHWISAKSKSNHVLSSLGAANPQATRDLYTYSPN